MALAGLNVHFNWEMNVGVDEPARELQVDELLAEIRRGRHRHG